MTEATEAKAIKEQVHITISPAKLRLGFICPNCGCKSSIPLSELYQNDTGVQWPCYDCKVVLDSYVLGRQQAK